MTEDLQTLPVGSVDAFPAALAGPELTAALEGLLVVLDRPLDVSEVADAWSVEATGIEAALNALQTAYADSKRGFVLRETATGWRLFAALEVRDRVQAVVARETSSRLSAAALETLAVVAYQQPVGRARVAAVRGVSVDAVMRTLTARGLIDVVSRDQATGASLYGTTEAFLEAVGLRTLGELPDLAPLLPDVTMVLGLSNEGST
jgi:segregation and condensation protein B